MAVEGAWSGVEGVPTSNRSFYVSKGCRGLKPIVEREKRYD